jgi:predicted PolB exonuclease-like 3'-5' exonuclease
MKYVYDIETYCKDESNMVQGKYSPFPLKEQIISIALLPIDHDTEPFVFTDTDEKQILIKFINIATYATELIGFNNTSFDWPFIITRCFVNGIKIPDSIKLAKQIDLRVLFTGNNLYTRGTLRDYVTALGLEYKTPNGSTMKEYYETNKFDIIRAHCAEDVILTKAMYLRCQECGIL